MNSISSISCLALQNCHDNDKNIQFIEEGHKYIIYQNSDVKYTSVTTVIHSLFEKFDADLIISKMMNGKSWKKGHKYWDMTPQQIKDLWNKNASTVSSAGTQLHYDIECFMNNAHLSPGYSHQQLFDLYTNSLAKCNVNENTLSTKEWSYFINYLRELPDMVPYRTEWTIFHNNLKLAGTIDMVYEKKDGTLAIYDWKRCKDISKINNFNKFAILPSVCHLPDSNFWHYALQLNIYKRILEDKYDKVVSELCLVRLHPESKELNFELIPVPFMKQEIDDIVALRISTMQF